MLQPTAKMTTEPYSLKYQTVKECHFTTQYQHTHSHRNTDILNLQLHCTCTPISGFPYSSLTLRNEYLKTTEKTKKKPNEKKNVLTQKTTESASLGETPQQS